MRRAWIAALLLALAPAAARAADAPPDTTLDQYLGRMADSTDVYFGPAAAPVDTAGLDSALTWGLAHPQAAGRTPLRPRFGPWFHFNRVDGPVYGASATVGLAEETGRLAGSIGWAAGPGLVLGAGRFQRAVERGGTRWLLDLTGGRFTASMNRDDPADALTVLQAFVTGSDRSHYLRHDGVRVSLARETPVLRAEVAYRDMLESPRAVTATWTAFGGRADLDTNLAAAWGRVREVAFDVGAKLPRHGLYAEASYATSGRALGSDFEYRRTRLAAGLDLPLARVASLVPQVIYGRLSGRMVPQAAFYLGGSGTLRSLDHDAVGGTGLALARVEVIGASDVLAAAHVPHPEMLSLQLGAFAASGAVWGDDPYGGPGAAGVDWPRRAGWRSEAGLSLLYRPGLPEPESLIRLNVAWPIGPGAHETRWSLGYTRALDLLHPFGE